MNVINKNCGVKIKLKDGTVREFKFVGSSSDVDPAKGCISIECPVGRALLGAGVGEKRKYTVNGKEFEVEVLEVVK